jgi:hypothetical protein
MDWRILILASALIGVSGGAFAKAVIVRSAGPSAKAYPPGKALPDSAKIALQPGDSLTIVGGNSARTLRGPGTFPAAAAGAQGLALAASRRTRFGALRTGELALNPSPWNVDATQSGATCAARGSPPKIWRPESGDAAQLTISKASGTPTIVSWPAGKSTVDWPSNVPIADGAKYRLTLSGSADAQDVRFVLIPSIPKDLTEAAQVLVQRGCQNQLDVLVAGLEKAE